MSDQPDTPADDDASLFDRAVLSTKLHVPRPPPTFVPRSRLGDRLDRAGPGTTILVCAPAGCGKSVLVADWCRHRASAVAWLSLDDEDNDPIRFWRHLAAAVGRQLGGRSLEDDVDRLIRRSGDPPLDRIAVTVLNAIGDLSDDLVLVLEDYHAIDEDDVHAGLRLLVDRAPEQLRVVVITRSDPPLLLARRRAGGELTEIREADLRFSADEASAFLERSIGGRIPRQAVSILAERTEGWAVGLQLAALSLDGRDDVSSFVSSFSGSHRFVLDYLTEEVLDRQPDHLRDFLLSTSVLQRLSGPLCSAVTGREDGHELLDACERANLFLVPLDDERRWWRYHHLFADLLRLRLEHGSPGRATELHRRAASWHELHGSIDQAVGHAVAAHDPAWAVRLVERHADELLFRREGATLRRQLADLPSGATRRLLVAQARSAAYAGRLVEADSLLDAADRAGSHPEPAFEPSVDRAASPLAELDPAAALVRAFVAHLRGQEDVASSLARRAYADVDRSGGTVALIAQWYAAVGPWLRGEVTVAGPALAADVERWAAADDPDRGALSGHYLGQVQRAGGDPDAAADTYRTVLSQAKAGTPNEAPVSAIAHVGLGEIAYLRGDLDGARAHVEEGISRGRHLVYTQAAANGLATLGWIRHAEGDHDGAVAALDEAVDVGPDPDVVDLLDPVPVRRAQLLLALGDEQPAHEWTQFRGVGPDDLPYHPAEPAHLLLTRLMISRGQGDRALPLLDRLLHAADTDGRLGSVIEIEMLRSLALAGAGREDAVSALTRALRLAVPRSYVRVFVDEGARMADVLADLVATAPPGDEHDLVLGHVAMLIRELEGAGAGRGVDPLARQRLVVPLTERELEVLAHLATGKPNREIAAELYVSLNTVKKHITHILDKLGAPNRTAAVDRARSIGLLG